ncbi:MAG: HD domain-containing protein [Armatimonadetes bacterium]|nr:HD domain-containing protein [Armatimonadota bacterium]
MAWFCQIRDPVHDFIGLSELETKIIDTEVFQRLRGIHQLAMAYLVYPGALHTRFDHSLGVCHVAGLLAESLGLDEDRRRLVRLAALLHDIGHGPFSHVSENSLERFADRNFTGDNRINKEKIHEQLTVALIDSDPQLSDLISREQRKDIVNLLSGRSADQPVLKEIVSGPLDADKQDYLLRDSRFCGVQYGVFDLSQLHRSLIDRERSGEKALMVKADGVHALEQFVLAKYYLTTQVYRHRVRLVTDNMLTRAITLGIEVDNIDDLKKLYHYNGSAEFIENYTGWNDARFLLTFGGDAFRGTYCYQLVNRLIRRQLLKRVYASDIDKAAFPEPETRRILMNPPDDLRAGLEMEIAEVLARIWNIEIDPHLVILHTYSIKSVREQSRNDEEAILVDTVPRPAPFEEKSTLFRSIRTSVNEKFLEVYAPVEYGTPTERDKKLKAVAGEIRRVLAQASQNKEEPV